MLDRVLAEDAHHAHVVERDHATDRLGDPTEHVPELEGLRGGLRDLR
jgi:hypothetical protein